MATRCRPRLASSRKHATSTTAFIGPGAARRSSQRSSICLPTDLRPLALRSCGIGLGAYVTTIHLVPVISKKIPRAKYGCDLLKRPPRLQIEDRGQNHPRVARVVSAASCSSWRWSWRTPSKPTRLLDAHTLAAATLAIALAILLGFADDILDLEWRYKYALAAADGAASVGRLFWWYCHQTTCHYATVAHGHARR